MRNFLAVVILCSAASSHAVVATTSHIAPVPADSAWSFVGSLNGCSAVAIGAHTVLTADHVGGGNFILGGKTYRMASSEKAPKVSNKATDLRVVHLVDMLPGWYGLATSVATKATVTMVGYGGTGVVNAQSSGYQVLSGGVRRAGKNIISSKTTNDSGPVLLSLLDNAGESVLASGDSGGAWFVNNKLVGISDFVYTTDTKKPNYGFANKAYFGSGAIDLTNSTLKNWLAAQLSKDPPPRSMTVPEPGTWAALGLGVAAFLRRKRQD